MFTPHSEMNPRNLRDKYKDWIGKKVTVGLTTFHYVSGRWKAIEGYYAIFDVGSREIRINMAEIDTIADAPEAQAEFFK
jgi:hypothetical protein